MKIPKLITVIAMLIVPFMGCKKDKFIEKNGVCPLVLATDPKDKDINVALNKVITITFNEMINPKTITNESITIEGSSKIAGTITFDTKLFVVTFVPTVPLENNTTYVGKVKTSIKDVAGNALQKEYLWSFSTGKVISPTVISTNPINNETNVARNITVTAKFSMPMDNASLTTSTFILKQGTNVIAGVVSYADSVVSFNPSVNLLADSNYTATITTGAKSSTAISLAADYSWVFKTGNILVPKIISVDPINNATGVALNKTVTATFDMNMDSTLFNTTTFSLKQGTTVIPGVVSYANLIATFNPTADLESNLVYTATITTAIKNVAGIAIATNKVWSFTTINTTVPTVISTDPTNNATNVLVNKTITATFNIPMDAATITNSTFTLKEGANTIAGVVTYAGSTATFNPTADLALNTIYTATITTGAKSASGIAMNADFNWSFTTVLAIAPTVISTDPTNNATNVALNKTISATFSVPMDAGTISTTTFTVKEGANNVAGVVTYTGSTASYNPNSDLVSGKVYTCTITTGAQNVAGTPLANDYVWTFTTIVPVAPTVISTDPTNNATNVALNKTISATFSVPMDAGTISTTTFTVKEGANNVAGVVSYTGSTASYNPNSDLVSGKVYTCTITTGAQNVAGTPLAANYIWTFTAISIPPTVVSTDPANNATNVDLNKTVTATFSEAMDGGTINTTSFTIKNGANNVAGVVSYAGLVATFNPNSNLLSGTTYTGTITTAAKNVGGTSLVSNYVWTFTTKAPTGGPFVELNGAAAYGILAGVGISNNAGFSEIHNMNVGISPGVRSSVTGFPPALVINGVIHCSDDATPAGIGATLVQVKQDLTNAYLFAEGATTPAPATVSGDQGGLTLAPGIYKSTSTLLIENGNLTLDAQGDANAVWIFQIASGFTTVGGAGGSVILSGGAQAKNVFWQVGSSAVIGDNTAFHGNVLALTSITMNSNATLVGRILCINGAIVLTSTNIINKP
jgi:hypothetical protein